MKTKIAVILILIAEISAAFFVGVIFSPGEHCGIKNFYTPPYFTISFFIVFVLLLIAAYMLWTKITKIAWFSCLALALINLGIMCWGAVYYSGIHCDGPFQITPDSFLATMSIIVAAIIALSLLFLLSDIKRIIRITATGNMENKTSSYLLEIMVSVIIVVLILAMMMDACTSTYYSCGDAAYTSVKSEIENAVAGYMQDSNHSSQLPIISDDAIFTLSNRNGSYYIINMSALLICNGGLIKTIPTGIIQLPGPNNDNCDGGTTGCHDTNHYIWGVDSDGNVASKFINSSEMNMCQCNTCDGYQGVWP